MTTDVKKLLDIENFEVEDHEISLAQISKLQEECREAKVRTDVFFERKIQQLNEELNLVVRRIWGVCSCIKLPFTEATFSRGKTAKEDISFYIAGKSLEANFQNLAKIEIMIEKLMKTIRYIYTLFVHHDSYIEKFNSLEQDFSGLTSFWIEDCRPWVRITMPSPNFELQQMSYTVPANKYYYELLLSKLFQLRRHLMSVVNDNDRGLRDFR